MKKTAYLILLGCTFGLAACQSTSQQYNGKTGYQVEEKTASSATLTYTLASDRNPNGEARKLQDACQNTLGTSKNYQIKILDSQEIMSPITEMPSENMKIGSSKTSFGFSNTPHLNNNQEAYASRQVEETHPKVLKIVRFTCS